MGALVIFILFYFILFVYKTVVTNIHIHAGLVFFFSSFFVVAISEWVVLNSIVGFVLFHLLYIFIYICIYCASILGIFTYTSNTSSILVFLFGLGS